jgi:hypothetical protein
MKKIIVLLSVLLTSCDMNKYIDFYVQNDCSQSVVVSVTGGVYKDRLQYILDTIYPYSREHLYQYYDIFVFTKSDIPYILQNMEITKNGNSLRYNPLDTTQWNFTYNGKYNYEAVLTVNENDF